MEEELEEFDEKKSKTPIKKKVEEQQPQYVAVPRVVPVSTMLNEIYDGQQEIKQYLLAILEKLK